MKFIHASDIHLGCQPDPGCPWSRERSFDILAAFRDLITACKKEKPDLLLLSGDLFHHQPSGTELKEADALFAAIPDIPVVMIAGNHDCIRLGSSLATFRWSPNVHFLSGRTLQSAEFPELGVTIWGFSYHQREIKEPVYETISAPIADGFHILLAHGGDTNHIPMNLNRFGHSGFSYTAIGHLHKPEWNEELRYGFAGSLSPIDMTEAGDHGYIVGELTENEEDPRGTLSLRFVPLDCRKYISCKVKVTTKTTNQSLYNTVVNFVEKYGTSNIYRLTITGSRDPEVNFDEEYLRSAGRIVSYSDETEQEFDIGWLYHTHARDIIGTYMDAFPGIGQEEDEDPLRKKAFLYGLNALLANFDSSKGGDL